jgi:hypothetical protein
MSIGIVRGWMVTGCARCGVIIRSRDAHRPHGDGRAHNACIIKHSRAAAVPSTPVPRVKRPYELLGPTQKRARRRMAREAVADVLEQVGVPMQTIQPTTLPTPNELLYLSNAEREHERIIPHAHMACG